MRRSDVHQLPRSRPQGAVRDRQRAAEAVLTGGDFDIESMLDPERRHVGSATFGVPGHGCCTDRPPATALREAPIRCRACRPTTGTAAPREKQPRSRTAAASKGWPSRNGRTLLPMLERGGSRRRRHDKRQRIITSSTSTRARTWTDLAVSHRCSRLYAGAGGR